MIKSYDDYQIIMEDKNEKIFFFKNSLSFSCFFLLSPSNNSNASPLNVRFDLNPQNVTMYTFGNPCRFYDYRASHPRRCAGWFSNSYIETPTLWWWGGRDRDHYRHRHHYRDGFRKHWKHYRRHH